MEEVEVKFLNINQAELESKLTDLGATKLFDTVYKRKVYDYPDLRLNSQNAWMRVRDEGNKVTVSFKQRLDTTSQDGSTNDGSMEEVEIEVSDFAKTCLIFDKLGLTPKFYQENRRIRYTLNDIEFDIDTWPELSPYLEIEAASWDKIDEGIKLLGLNAEDKKVFSTHQIYALQGIDEHDYSEMTFDRMVKK